MQTPDTSRPEAGPAPQAMPQGLPEWQAALDVKLRQDAERSLALMAFWAVPLAHMRAFWARWRGRRA